MRKLIIRVCRAISAEWLFIIFALLIVLALGQSYGKLEARYFPVVDNVEVSLVDYYDEQGHTELYLDFHKVRDTCSFRGIRFFLLDGPDGEIPNVQMKAVFAGQEQVRRSGSYSGVGPWNLRATPDQLSNMEVQIFHSCHAGFHTISRFRTRDGKLEAL